MREVAEDVFAVSGTDVNWVLVRDGDALTLIDGGWPGDATAVEESVRAVGCRPEDVQAVLLTHAHIDHMGALSRLHERYGTPAYAGPGDVEHARTGRLEQARIRDVVTAARRPSGLAWLTRIVRAGATRPLRIPHLKPLPDGERLDLPGSPLPVPCPGHTTGHHAYLLEDHGVLITGDALVAGHPLSRIDGPQLLPSFFSHAPDQALSALDVLAVQPAEVIVPGHGAPWRGEPAIAAAGARARAIDPIKGVPR